MNKKGEDPVYHFYETFLTEYDPEEREKRGVYYTPTPVVSYIARSLHLILKEKFKISDGLADTNITVLDPAGGTLTFLTEATKHSVNEFVEKYGDGALQKFIRDHILQNFYSFEIMVAPYTLGHLKIAFLLEELGYKLQKDERFKFYLTNTLEMEEIEQTALPGMRPLSEESRKAGEVKKKIPILAIIGNPPYSVSSSNKSVFIEKEMEMYKQDVRDEKNIQPLSDDYIKFIRFAHWKIGNHGKGIIGFITNNSYISGLIHRGMRKKLLGEFDEIYILNLHGSSRIEEKPPNEQKDENVFDIQQGVAISFYLKFDKPLQKKKIQYADLWGTRKIKYSYLLENDLKSTIWKELDPKEPLYFFVPKKFVHSEKYNKFIPLTKLFNKWCTGIKTHRDKFAVSYSKDEVKKKYNNFVDSNVSEKELKDLYSIHDTEDWKITEARESARIQGFIEENIKNYSYRLFDDRVIYYNSILIDRRRPFLGKQFSKPNLAIVTTRQLSSDSFNHVFVTQNLSDICLISSKTKESSYFFVLYLYVNRVKKPNINEQLLKRINEVYEKQLSPDEIFYYIYAVLYSNLYKQRYDEFLKIDYPRVPFTTNFKLFLKMSKLGRQLVNLHLLNSKKLDKPIIKFQGKGDGAVKKPQYKKNEKKVFINDTQNFEGIPNKVWAYKIGAYQVLEKWLKVKRGSKLTLNEIKHYCKIATVISKTIEIQRRIDRLYLDIEKEVIEFKEKKQNAHIDKYA